MSSSSSSGSLTQLRALLARERSRRRAAEEWATFLVTTLDSYVRASHAYGGRVIDESDDDDTGSDSGYKTHECDQFGNCSGYNCELMSSCGPMGGDSGGGKEGRG